MKKTDYKKIIIYYKGKEKTERHKLLSARGRSAKMAANGIRTHTRTNQRPTLDRGRGNFVL